MAMGADQVVGRGPGARKRDGGRAPGRARSLRATDPLAVVPLVAAPFGVGRSGVAPAGVRKRDCACGAGGGEADGGAAGGGSAGVGHGDRGFGRRVRRRRGVVVLLDVQDLVELALHGLLDLLDLAHGATDLAPDLGQPLGPEDEQSHEQDDQDLGRADLGHQAPFPVRRSLLG